MRTIAALIMTSSLAALIWVMHEALVISVSHSPGLINPTIQLGLKPDFRDMLFAMLLVAAISTYCYGSIAWTEKKLQEIRSLLGASHATESSRQPEEVRRLKEAIRSGDAGAVKRHAKRAAFRYNDDHFLTPIELADLYGNQPVIDALRTEMLKQARQKAVPGQPVSAPSSQFALRAAGSTR